MAAKKQETFRQKEKKRQLIIEAAIKVFSAQGFYKARMENIAELAGIGKGTIYEYFSSKLDLFKAIIESSFQFYMQLIDAETKRGASIEDLIYELFRSHMEFCMQNCALGNILFKEHNSMGEDFESWLLGLHIQQRQKITSILQAEVDAKRIRPVDVKVVNHMIEGIMAGLALSVVVERETFDIEEVCGKAKDILMHGIAVR